MPKSDHTVWAVAAATAEMAIMMLMTNIFQALEPPSSYSHNDFPTPEQCEYNSKSFLFSFNCSNVLFLHCSVYFESALEFIKMVLSGFNDKCDYKLTIHLRHSSLLSFFIFSLF